RNFKDNMFETSVEVYYKDMQNVIDYRNGANLFFNEGIEGDLVYGDGRAYGAEFYIKKNKGRLTGWVSYTLSRTLRQFDEINNGEEFPARQDRIHDLAIVGLYKLSPKLTLSANWVFNTGDAVTFPSGRYEIDGKVVPYYTERNGYRMPNYHRMDLGLTWMTKKTERFEGSWNFSVYNAYGRENAYSIDFQTSEGDSNSTEAVQLSLFRWVPSVTYNFKF
ncbi:MAG: TonB-dependent receptor, partial [Bacteroidota bacterium]